MRSHTPDPGLAAAFPRHLHPEVRQALTVLPPANHPPAHPFQVLVSGETVTIPYRIYAPEPPPPRLAELPPTQQSIVDCLYTRHHDGQVRQRHLERILDLPKPWTAPFVVQLVGEYVVEILLAIHHHILPALTDPTNPLTASYGTFAAENTPFMARTSRRVQSYWDCYHRARYPTFTDYPGHLLVTALEAAAVIIKGGPGDDLSGTSAVPSWAD